MFFLWALMLCTSSVWAQTFVAIFETYEPVMQNYTACVFVNGSKVAIYDTEPLEPNADPNTCFTKIRMRTDPIFEPLNSHPNILRHSLRRIELRYRTMLAEPYPVTLQSAFECYTDVYGLADVTLDYVLANGTHEIGSSPQRRLNAMVHCRIWLAKFQNMEPVPLYYQNPVFRTWSEVGPLQTNYSCHVANFFPLSHLVYWDIGNLIIESQSVTRFSLNQGEGTYTVTYSIMVDNEHDPTCRFLPPDTVDLPANSVFEKVALPPRRGGNHQTQGKDRVALPPSETVTNYLIAALIVILLVTGPLRALLIAPVNAD